MSTDLPPPSDPARAAASEGLALEQVLERLYELPAAERKPWLDARVEDPDLRAEAEALLEHLDDTGGFLGDPAIEVLDAVSASRIGEQLGAYRLVRLLGEGGMGRVYLAEQEEPLRRQVALKILESALPDGDRMRRFRAERQALARMAHPNIAHLYEAGGTPDGRLWFAMELVAGQPITQAAEQLDLGLESRVRLMIAVCEAVQHAHEKGLIHRDLKPSNILLGTAEEGSTSSDEQGNLQPKVIDFGIVKAIDDPLLDVTLVTRDGVFGTPTYMPPEAIQRVDGHADVDTRSDVYALGVVLYELLCGATPLDGNLDLATRLRRISEGDLPSMAARFSHLPPARAKEIADRRQCSVDQLRTALDHELGWIVGRAIEPEREARYPSAAALAEDLARYLRNEPVLASPPLPFYELRKLAARYRVAATAVLLASLAILLALATTTYFLFESNRARAESEAVSDYLLTVFGSVDPWTVGSQKFDADSFLDYANDRLATDLGEYPDARLELLRKIADSNFHRGRMEVATEQYEALAEETGRLFGESSREVAALAPDLAQIYSQQGRVDEAVALLERAIRIHEATETWAGRAHGNLGDILVRFGRFHDAEPHLRRSWALRKARDPDGSPLRWVGAMSNLGTSLAMMGRSEETNELAAQLLGILRESETREYEYARRLLGYARMVELNGNIAEARDCYAEILAISRKALDPTDERIGRYLVNLARTERLLGRTESARELLDEAAGLIGHVEDAFEVRVRTQLAALALDRGDRAEAARQVELARAKVDVATEWMQRWRLEAQERRLEGAPDPKDAGPIPAEPPIR